MVVESGLVEWWWWLSGGGIEGGCESNLSAVVMERAVEVRWIGGGTVGGLAVDWW